VRRSEVVGRRLELAQIGDTLADVSVGLRVCVLAGPAGMGKTTVWRRAVELAREDGIVVLSSCPAAAEARLSYSGLFDLLAGIEAEHFEPLPGVQRRALEIALLRSEADENVVDARAVGSGLLSLLRDLTARSPLVLAVDDAHWLDSATAGVVAFALRRLGEAPVAVLASVRREERRQSTFLDAVPARSREEIELGPLSVGALHAIVRDELGRAPSRPVLVRLATATGGNPLHTIEVARELFRTSETGTAEVLPIPQGVGELVRRRLERLPRRTRTTLLEAASLAVPRAELLTEADLAPAETAGVVAIAQDGRITFAHPLFAAAVYESATPAQRRTAHRSLAARVADPEECARHLALSTTRPDAAIAEQLESASASARARGATPAAAELAELALELSPDTLDPALRGQRLLAAAACAFEVGDLVRAEQLLERARDTCPPGPVLARALRLLGQLCGRRSSFAGALTLVREALGVAADDPELVAELELDAAYYSTSLGDIGGAQAHADAAVGAAETAGDGALLASALAVRTMIGFLCGRGLAEEDIRDALDGLDPTHPRPLAMDPRFIQGLLDLWVGRVDPALATLERVRAETLARGRESEVPLMYLYLVWACLWSGDVGRALALAEEGRETAALLSDDASNALVLSACALANAYGGDAEQARGDAEQALSLFAALEWHSGTIWPRWALGYLELSLGNFAATRAALEPLTAAGPLPGDPVLSVFVPDSIEALVQLGRADDAEALLLPFAERSRALDRQWALAAAERCCGLLAAARGDLEDAYGALERALAYHDGATRPLDRARTLLVLGRVHRRRKQKRLARQTLEEALGVFERQGLPLWAETTRRELARVTTRSAGGDLSATEERIARLAADGLTNRAIAEQTFVSVKTVETNLRRAYRKLGITSRAQLARALDDLHTTPIS
jgi:DNA-binding CsgD family transcriptional regulator